jgi:hypothetical protein
VKTYRVAIGRDTFTIEGCHGPTQAMYRALHWWFEDGGDPSALVGVVEEIV